MVVMRQVRLDARDEQRRAVVSLKYLQRVLVDASLFGRHVATELQKSLLFPLPVKIGAILVASKELRFLFGRQ